MNKLREIARMATSLSVLMDNREKVTTEDIIKKLDGVISIKEVDMVNDGKNEYPVILFAEDENAFYCGGIVLKKMVQAWIEYCETLEKVNEMLAKDPVKVRLEEAKTKDGKNNITKITIM